MWNRLEFGEHASSRCRARLLLSFFNLALIPLLWGLGPFVLLLIGAATGWLLVDNAWILISNYRKDRMWKDWTSTYEPSLQTHADSPIPNHLIDDKFELKNLPPPKACFIRHSIANAGMFVFFGLLGFFISILVAHKKHMMLNNH